MQYLIAWYDNYIFTKGMGPKPLAEYYIDKKPLSHLEYHYYYGTFKEKTHDISHLLIGENEVEKKKRFLIALYNDTSRSLGIVHDFRLGEDDRLINREGKSRKDVEWLLLSTPEYREDFFTQIAKLFWTIFAIFYAILVERFVLIGIIILVMLFLLHYIVALVFVLKRYCHPSHDLLISQSSITDKELDSFTKEVTKKRKEYYDALVKHDSWVAGRQIDSFHYYVQTKNKWPRKELPMIEGDETGYEYRWRLITHPCEEEQMMTFYVELWWYLSCAGVIVPLNGFLLSYMLVDSLLGMMGWKKVQWLGVIAFMVTQPFSWVMLIPRFLIPAIYALKRTNHIIYGACNHKERESTLYPKFNKK